MKVKEFTVEMKKSKNYQTYGASVVVEVKGGEDFDELQANAYGKLRKIISTQMELDSPKVIK